MKWSILTLFMLIGLAFMAAGTNDASVIKKNDTYQVSDSQVAAVESTKVHIAVELSSPHYDMIVVNAPAVESYGAYPDVGYVTKRVEGRVSNYIEDIYKPPTDLYRCSSTS